MVKVAGYVFGLKSLSVLLIDNLGQFFCLVVVDLLFSLVQNPDAVTHGHEALYH